MLFHGSHSSNHSCHISPSSEGALKQFEGPHLTSRNSTTGLSMFVVNIVLCTYFEVNTEPYYFPGKYCKYFFVNIKFVM